MSKPKSSAPPSAGGNAAPSDPPTFRSNPEVDAKIDAYIKESPKYWAYVQAMPRERLERTAVLNEVREIDRQQRIIAQIARQARRAVARSPARPLARSQGQQQRTGEAVGM